MTIGFSALLDIGLVLGIIAMVAGIVRWEFNKMATMKREIALLREDMKQLHEDHRALIQDRDREHTEVLRNLTVAINKMHSSIDELTHYIRWLGKAQTGNEPPPPIGVRNPQ